MGSGASKKKKLECTDDVITSRSLQNSPSRASTTATPVSVSSSTLSSPRAVSYIAGESPLDSSDITARNRNGVCGEALLAMVRADVIGNRQMLHTPFGKKKIEYADYTASGRAMGYIERFIEQEVLPFYANTHTMSSGTGQQTTRLREEARMMIKQCCNCKEDDALIFVGSGSTGAINKLVDILNLRLPADLDEHYRLRDAIPLDQRPVVFVGPYEHHSNYLPFFQSLATVVEIDETTDGTVDLQHLRSELIRYKNRPLKIGAISAGSNVSGVQSPTEEMTALLHMYGALSFWDYAAAGPYVDINMNPSAASVPRPENSIVPPEHWTDANLAKDAIYLSPHKFVGGPGSPGVLIVKKHVVANTIPSQPGGGTVLYVVDGKHTDYSPEIEHREEAGTPNIVGCIRAGLAFQLKSQIGADVIMRKEHEFLERAFTRWRNHPRIHIVGPTDVPRLGILAFLVRDELPDRYIHHEVVVAMLNDVFGIQARAGCNCAGPYGMSQLEITEEVADGFMRLVEQGFSGEKPGWTRINFTYFEEECCVDFIIRAVELIADHGWRLLPLYQFDPHSGEWRHRMRGCECATRFTMLKDVQFAPDGAHWPTRCEGDTLPRTVSLADYYQRCLADGEALMLNVESQLAHVVTMVVQEIQLQQNAPSVAGKPPSPPSRDANATTASQNDVLPEWSTEMDRLCDALNPPVTPLFEQLRWFPLPGEILRRLWSSHNAAGVRRSLAKSILLASAAAASASSPAGRTTSRPIIRPHSYVGAHHSSGAATAYSYGLPRSPKIATSGTPRTSKSPTSAASSSATQQPATASTCCCSSGGGGCDSNADCASVSAVAAWWLQEKDPIVGTR